jgi:hypothetical protein
VESRQYSNVTMPFCTSESGTKRQLPRIYDAGPLWGVERQRSCDCREGGGSSAFHATQQLQREHTPEISGLLNLA